MSDNTPNIPWKRIGAVVLVCLALALVFIVFKNYQVSRRNENDVSLSSPAETAKPENKKPNKGGNKDVETAPAEETPVVSEPVETPKPALPEFHPYAVESTLAEKYVRNTGVMVNGTVLPSVEDYVSERKIDFGLGEDYSALPGVITFRGSNFRGGGAYGTARLSAEKFDSYWRATTGSLTSSDGYTWSGNGWTGQPLIVQWPKETRAIMNMYDWAKEKDTLTEVIYASMDGYVYFYELTSGSKTRDALYLGYTFKGAGALDPRGYPILYLGSGYNSALGGSHAFIVSLVDCSILYEFGQWDSFALRGWNMFDASPLVDAETDTLIYPGESGILYLIHLNSKYDEAAGTISIEPEMTKWRYNNARYFGWLGFEDSAVIWRSHLFIADNGGNLICLDLNTLQVVWAQDVLDDTNCTPMLELENGHPYLYISTSFHYGWRSYSTAEIPIWKIDAVTGEIVWKRSYDCYTVQDVSGGVQGSPAMGQHELSNLVFFPVSRYPSAAAGWLVALDKRTGEQVWNVETQIYSWSSPTLIYNADGKGYVVYCTSGGYMYLLDGLTGEMLDFMDLGSNIEASPAVFNNTIVVGTRASGIWGVTMK